MMNPDVRFTEEARKALLEGGLVADRVEEVPFIGRALESWVPVPVMGNFKIGRIEFLRFRSNMFRVTMFLESGLPFARFEAHLETSESVSLDDLDMRLQMKLS